LKRREYVMATTKAAKGTTKKKAGKEAILEALETMSVIELAELVKELEEKFGVTAATPIVQAAYVPAAGGAAPEAGEEKTEFTVVLAAIGEKKIQVIKEIRAITGLGLKEAKDLVDGAPKPVKEAIPKEEADDIKRRLEEVGATVEVK
jgi:large subunit ribosomal protein L7/L12